MECETEVSRVTPLEGAGNPEGVAFSTVAEVGLPGVEISALAPAEGTSVEAEGEILAAAEPRGGGDELSS